MVKSFIKKWVFFFVIVVFSFIIGLRTSLEFFFYFFWVITVTLALSLFWLSLEYVLIQLHLARIVSSKIEEDDTLLVRVEVRNKTFFPLFNLVIEDSLSEISSDCKQKRFLLGFLGPRSSVTAEYNCLCRNRGRYKIGPLTAYLFDPLGLFFLKKTYFLYSEVYVYPRTFRIRRLPLVKGVLPWFGIDTARSGGDEDEFFGIREYKEGDPIKIIHWLSSARKNKLIVKEFQRQSFFRASIIFNLEKERNFGDGKDTVAEYTVKIAASLARFLTEHDVAVEIIAHAQEMVYIPFNKGIEHMDDIFKFLAVAKAESRVSLIEVFEEFFRYIPTDSTLIVIMLDKDCQYLQEIASLQNRNVFIVPLILMSPSFLSASDRQKIIQDIQCRLPASTNFSPIYIGRGDNLEEAFLQVNQ